MRNLVVCCDGTWNTPDQEEHGVPVPTNVVRLYNALAEKDNAGNEQVRYYHTGVGTEGNWWQKMAGGIAGVGLKKNVMSAYRWLAGTYQLGDQIFLFGFSRGAYTVRSVAGMISACGLLDLSSGVTDDELWKRVEAAYDQGYRADPTRKKPRSTWAKEWRFFKTEHRRYTETGDSDDVGVYFLGVWDTVGALGIPDDMAILNLLDNRKDYLFHDANLNEAIQHACHAVSIDEMRASFAPTLWANARQRSSAKEVWFPGVHCDIGGGYLEKGLSDGALKWMIDEARTHGLAFEQPIYDQVDPNHLDVLHDSRTGIFKLLRTQPRGIPLLSPVPNAPVHRSALDRQAYPPIAQTPYRKTILLDPNTSSKEIPIYAINPWNETGIFLEPGATYQFVAKGQWVDGHIACGPAGTRDGVFEPGELVQMGASLLGKLEKIYKKITGNTEADLRGTKRIEDAPWFALMGVVANGGFSLPDGSFAPHEQIVIGEGIRDYSPKRPGYLWCFANDAWHFYNNNHGSVTLTVTRTK